LYQACGCGEKEERLCRFPPPVPSVPLPLPPLHPAPQRLPACPACFLPMPAALDFGAKRRRKHSWRDGQVSDWSVVLGEREFQLHRWQLLQASGFFEGHFRDGFAATLTDLTSVLPCAAWKAFEACLDHVYSESEAAELAADLVMPLLKIADILEMESLFLKSSAQAKELLCTDPVTLLRSAEGLIEGAGDKLRALYEQALEGVRTRFEDLAHDKERVEALLDLPVAIVAELLSADFLEVESEETVLRFIERYAARRASPAKGLGSEAEAQLWRLLRVPCLGPEGMLQLRRMGLEERVGLPVQHGMWLRLARSELHDGGVELQRLLREAPELQAWCTPRLALRPAVIEKALGREITQFLVGSRPLHQIENVGRAFDVRLNGPPEFIVGVCFDGPKALSKRLAWESVRYLAANSNGVLNGGGGGGRARCTGKMRTCLGALKGFQGLGTGGGPPERRARIEEGDVLRVQLSAEAQLVVSVNGVPTVSAELAPFLRDIGQPRERRPGSSELLPDMDGVEVYPMVGVPDLATVTLMPAVAP